MIEFGVWAPSKAAFYSAWETAGIGQLVDGVWEYNAPYAGGIQTTAESWSGVVVQTPGTYDAEGNEITPPVLVNGWHCNVRVHSQALIDQFTDGLDQYETDGEGNQVLKDVFDRTNAATIFSLSSEAANGTTGFPAGQINASGIVYTDKRNFTSPANVWA
jgi:hypothetical protein